MKWINFNFHYIFILIIIRSICYAIRFIIEFEYKKYFKDPIIKLFLLSIGQSLAIFFYFIQKKINENKLGIKTDKNDKYIKPTNNKTRFFIFICAILNLFTTYNYSIFYSFKMKKVYDNSLDIDMTYICLFIPYIEKKYLKIDFYIHHYLGLSLIFISIFSGILLYFIKDFEIFYSIEFIYHILICLETEFILSQLYLIETKLIFESYQNIYIICFLEGIFEILILLLYFFIYYLYHFGNLNNFFNSLNLSIEISHISELYRIILFSILLIFLILIINISRLIIIEKTRPSHITIANLLFVFITTIYYLHDKTIELVFAIIPIIIGLLGSLIFCEVISLNFCNLNLFTINRIRDRADSDTRNTILLQIEFLNEKINEEKSTNNIQ